MNTEFDEQQIKDLFSAEAQEIPATAVSTDQIVSRGRVYKRRRGAILGVTAVVAASGIGYGAFRALQPGSGQLATSTATEGSEAPATTAAVTSAAAPATDASGLSEATNAEIDESEMQLPAPYRDGFLLMRAVPSDDGLVPESTAVSFAFTTDGTDVTPLGAGVEVAGFITQPAVVGDTVLLLSSDGDTSPMLHLYWSDDLTNWSEDVIDASAIADRGRLSPAMAELVDAQFIASTVATDGDEWVAGMHLILQPSDAVKQRFDVGENDFPFFTSSGMMISSESDERVISPEELGVTKEDLAVFDDLGSGISNLVLSGHRGQTEFATTDGTKAPLQSVVALGDRFVGLNGERQLLVSPDGSAWSPLAFAVGEGESVSSISTIQGDLLVLTSDDVGTKAYRMTADGTATGLGAVPGPPGSTLQQMSLTGQPIFTAIEGDESMVSDFVMLTEDYEVTIVAPESASAAMDEIHYVIRDRATGEIVAEDTRPGGSWIMGDEVDGELVVTFTDSEGRPDVMIPSAELDAAEEQTISETSDTSAVDGTASGGSSETDGSMSVDGSVPAVATAGLDWNQVATADGVRWYNNPDPDHSYFMAVNGSNLLIGYDDGETSTLEVVDLNTVATEQSE